MYIRGDRVTRSIAGHKVHDRPKADLPHDRAQDAHARDQGRGRDVLPVSVLRRPVGSKRPPCEVGCVPIRVRRIALMPSAVKGLVP
jgi:hypothetical protein